MSAIYEPLSELLMLNVHTDNFNLYTIKGTLFSLKICICTGNKNNKKIVYSRISKYFQQMEQDK